MFKFFVEHVDIAAVLPLDKRFIQSNTLPKLCNTLVAQYKIQSILVDLCGEAPKQKQTCVTLNFHGWVFASVSQL